MFRSIRGSLDKRKESLQKGTDQQKTINRVMREFLTGVIGPAGSQIRLETTFEHKNLFIRSQSKTVSNEIIFHSKALYELLKKNGIACEKVIIQ